MNIDVTDLFCSLFEVAKASRVRFNFWQFDRYGFDCPEWQMYCEYLSDALFLPACAKRAFEQCQTKMSSDEIKPRIIAHIHSDCGRSNLYVRYLHPYFYDDARFSARLRFKGSSYDESIFICPPRALTLWLGDLPPYEVDIDPPAYPDELKAPIRYFARVWFTFHNTRPQVSYYELHGDWCLREVRQSDAAFFRKALGGQWRMYHDTKEIRKDVFESVWDAASEEPQQRVS